MIIQDILPALEAIAPLKHACSWDNVGLLAGSSRWTADAILLTIDLTEAVLQEAVESSIGLIVAYHPPIFQPVKSVTDRSPLQRIVLEAIRAGIAVYSPHTALDAAPGGVNDWIAEGVGRGDVRALEAIESQPESQQCKIVTFCPAEAIDAVRNGLASVGAGRIGEYQLCSFELRGQGTFLAGEKANPTVGRRGRLERIDEVRLEMVCPRAALGLAIVTLRQFHPYEEPPIEVYPLQPHPLRTTGQGRRLTLDQPAALKTIVERVKKHLGIHQVQVASGRNAPTKLTRIGLCAGSGGSLIEAALTQGCEAFITGELRHHDVLAAQAKGCTVIVAGHTNTERGYLKTLRKRLDEALPDVTVAVSKRDADPLKTM